MQALLNDIAKLIEPQNFFTDYARRLSCARQPAWASDQGTALPLAIARPVHMGQAKAVLEFCSRNGLKIAIRGGGTGAGRVSYDEKTIVLLSTGLRRLWPVDVENRLVTAEPGVTCGELRETVEMDGLFYPPNPGSGSVSTIGGNVAANAAGASVVKYGATSHYVSSVEVLGADGRHFRFHAQNWQPGKLSAAYPLAALFCGSAGTLGFLGPITLRLLPKPLMRKGVFARFENAVQAAAAAGAIMASRLLPTALEMADGLCSPIMYGDHESGISSLFVEFDGNREEIESSLDEARELLARSHARDIREAGGEGKWDASAATAAVLPGLWARKGKFRLETIVCPPASLASLVENIREIADSHGVEAALFGSAGVSRLQVALFYENETAMADKAAGEIFTLERVLNGGCEIGHDLDMSGGEGHMAAQDADIFALSQGIRSLFDPAGILRCQPLPEGR